MRTTYRFFSIILLLLCCLPGLHAWAQTDKDFPQLPNPPRLVNDFASLLSPDEQALLEKKLLDYSNSSSVEISVVTLQTIGSYDIADYAVQLFNRWHIGGKKNNTGVLILVSKQDHKMNITTGYGMEGALTDATSSSIIRNQMRPWFRQDKYYDGLVAGSDAIIAATKGEYKSEQKPDRKKGGAGIIAIVLIVYFIIWLINKMRGGGGGNYISNRGRRHLGGGWYGGFGGFGGGSWGGGDSGGGGFGGFGGGSSGGGGASGSW